MTWHRLFDFAPQLEKLGYDSAWARDNLGYQGHGFELAGSGFVDPFTTLAGIAARTERLGIGTAVLTPFRPALVTAQLLGGLTFLSRNRLELGVGPGTPRIPWEALGIPYEERVARCREMVEVARLVAQPGPASYVGTHTRFRDVTIDPAPEPDMPVWYGGASPASLRAVRAYADGIIPGRCPFTILDRARDGLRAASDEDGRPYRIGSIPLVSVGRDREDALSKLPIDGIVDTARERWRLPIDDVNDLSGALIYGDRDDCLEQLQAFVDRDVELVIVDLRLLMNEFEDAAAAFAEIIERLPPSDAPALPSPDREPALASPTI